MIISAYHAMLSAALLFSAEEPQARLESCSFLPIFAFLTSLHKDPSALLPFASAMKGLALGQLPADGILSGHAPVYHSSNTPPRSGPAEHNREENRSRSLVDLAAYQGKSHGLHWAVSDPEFSRSIAFLCLDRPGQRAQAKSYSARAISRG